MLALTAGFLLVEFALALPTLANGGRLDQSFSVDGKARVQSLLPQAVAFQADGKIVVGGSEQFPDHAPWFAVARLGADGRLDPTFGGDGIVSKPFGARLGCYGIVYSVAVEPDGKIVATGSSCGGAITVARFNPDGTLDVGFGDAGKVFIEGVGTCRVNAYGIAGALGVRGRIAVAGWGACGGTSSSFTVIAIRHDGTLDPNFSGDGLAEVSVQKGVFGTAIGKGPIAGVVVQPDGKIVIAGSAQYYCPPEGECYSDFAVFRFLSSGTLDQGFGHGDGAVTTKFPGPRCGGGGEAEGLALQPDGKIVVGGLAGCTAGPGTGSHPRWALIRYQANGTLDPDFGGGDGRVVSILLKEEGGDAMYGGLALQANGKIVGAGNLNSPLGGYFALARYRTDGRPDQTFGHHGMVQIVGWGTAWAVAIQADGKIVAVGDGVARFLPS